MDSYFASIEQQANPHLRGKCVVVSGKEGSRTIIVAASKEAKKFGVKTAMAQFEARKLCPELYFVYPDGAKYQETTSRFIKIFKSFTDKVEIFSIDEAFLDMTGFVKNFHQAEAVAYQIKGQVREKLGEWVTCSVGIAHNKLLAKLGSDINKPDGVFSITDKNKIQVLDNIKLDDICGIGRRIKRRLEAMGIETIPKLRSYPLKYLIMEFGPYYGTLLQQMSNGQDFTSVIPYYEEAEIKSAGRSYTLPHNTYDKKIIFGVLLRLSEKCGRQLRRKKLAGKTLQYYFRFADFTHWGTRTTLRGYINDGLTIYKTGYNLLNDIRLPKAVRLVGVRVSNLVEHKPQLVLWKKDRKRIEVLPYLDEINDKYGELTIKPAFLADSPELRRKVGGFKYDAN